MAEKTYNYPMENYKELDKSLVGIVNSLKMGDGIVIRYKANYLLARSEMGYVHKKKEKFLELTHERKEENSGCLGFLISFNARNIRYKNIASIKLVDPVSNE